MEEFAIGADFKSAAAGWNQGQRFDAFAEVENLRRQTDSLGRVVSNHAVFDRDLGFHWTISFPSEIIGATSKGSRNVTAAAPVSSCTCEKSTKRKSRNRGSAAVVYRGPHGEPQVLTQSLQNCNGLQDKNFACLILVSLYEGWRYFRMRNSIRCESS